MSIEQWQQKIKELLGIEITCSQTKEILEAWQQLSPVVKSEILAVAQNETCNTSPARDRAIQIIDGLYPIDSEFYDTNLIGSELLAQARREIGESYDWRNESDAVLVRYAELCEQREREEERRIRQRNANK